MAFDSRFSSTSFSLPSSARTLIGLTLSFSLIFLFESTSRCWPSMPNTMGFSSNSVRSSAAVCVCQALKFSRFSMSFCSLTPLSRRIPVTSCCCLSSCPDRAVQQQLGALADVRERRLELVRHVAQELVLLVRRFPEPMAQPLELPAQRLDIVSGPSRRSVRLKSPPPSSRIARSTWRMGRPTSSRNRMTSTNVPGISAADCHAIACCAEWALSWSLFRRSSISVRMPWPTSRAAPFIVWKRSSMIWLECPRPGRCAACDARLATSGRAPRASL